MDLTTVRFGTGEHEATNAPTGDRDLCIMEAVAFMAGEEWSDSPECASPVVTAFLRLWNDGLPDESRDRLLPAGELVPRLVGSRGGISTEGRRSFLAWDWLVRVYIPAWLDLVPSLAGHAAALRALPEVVNLVSANDTSAAVKAARDAAVEKTHLEYAAHLERAPAGMAAGDAAWAASAGEAAAAAADPFGSDAEDAASVSTRCAAVSGVDLKPTLDLLQQSALDLLDRMLSCGQNDPDRDDRTVPRLHGQGGQHG